MASKFKRVVRGSPNAKNARGRVRVQVVLLGKGDTYARKGNVTKTLSIDNTTVLEVFEALEKALF